MVVRQGAIALGVLSLGGCATTLSTSQPAHVPAKGHVHAEAGVDVSVSTGSIYRVIRASESLDDASATRTLSDDEKRALFEGASHLAANPPAVLPHVGIAYAPWERWEIGVRFATSGWRIGVRRQLLDQETSGVDASVGLGMGRAVFTPPIEDVLERIEVTDSSRWNLDVPMAIGRHGIWYRWWAGPRAIFSNVSHSMRASLPNDAQVAGTVDGNVFYLGGHAGAAMGFRSVFVGPELTLVYLLGSADVNALGQTRDVGLNAFIVYPAFAVMGEL